MNQDINIKVETTSDGEVIIRTGDALPLTNPDPMKFIGTLISPLEYLNKRQHVLNLDICHLVVNRENLTIQLIIDENYKFSDSITGQLMIDPVFKKFGINTGLYFTTIQLSDLFKMNRNCFGEKSTAAMLVSELRNIKLNVQKVIEKQKDTRGNERAVFEQIVSSNIPEKFVMSMPIFKGLGKQVFEVEMVFNADDQTVSLQSVDCNEIIIDFSSTQIDEVLEQIKSTYPTLTIFEK